jgi:hypothetical protein
MVKSSGLRVDGVGIRVGYLEFRVWVQGLGFRVQSSE